MWHALTEVRWSFRIACKTHSLHMLPTGKAPWVLPARAFHLALTASVQLDRVSQHGSWAVDVTEQRGTIADTSRLLVKSQKSKDFWNTSGQDGLCSPGDKAEPAIELERARCSAADKTRHIHPFWPKIYLSRICLSIYAADKRPERMSRKDFPPKNEKRSGYTFLT